MTCMWSSTCITGLRVQRRKELKCRWQRMSYSILHSMFENSDGWVLRDATFRDPIRMEGCDAPFLVRPHVYPFSLPRSSILYRCCGKQESARSRVLHVVWCVWNRQPLKAFFTWRFCFMRSQFSCLTCSPFKGACRERKDVAPALQVLLFC